MSNQQEKTATFKSWDGTELFYRTWQSDNESNRAVIYLHRGHEHSGRLSELVEGIGFSDIQAFAYDARGHGNLISSMFSGKKLLPREPEDR